MPEYKRTTFDGNSHGGIHDFEGLSVGGEEVLATDPKTAKINAFIEVAETGDDAGLLISGGQFFVGTQADPREFGAGEGDSVPVTYARHYDGVTFTDITEALRSDNSSQVDMFGSLTAGEVLLIGHDQGYYGVKAKIFAALAVADYGKLVFEYWNVGMGSFQPVDVCNVVDGLPYPDHGNKVMQTAGTSEQWWFDSDPYTETPVWGPSEIDGETALWGRIRIVTTLTVMPVLEQMKLHTSHVEFNKDGTGQWFGRSIRRVTLLQGLQNLIPNADSTPTDYDVKVASGMTIEYLGNKFASNFRQGGILIQNIPYGLNTAVKLLLKVDFVPLDNTAGDVNLQTNTVQEGMGVVHDGTATPSNLNDVVSIPINSLEKEFSAYFYIDIADLDSSGKVSIEVFRDGGVSPDTYGDFIGLTNVEIVGYNWLV